MKVEYKSVADLGDIVTGKTPSTGKAEYWDGDIPFITPTDIVGYDMRYIFDTERKVSNAAAVTQKKTIVPPNSICVSCIASIGKMCITFAERSITNQQINTIIVKDGYDYRYVFYLLRHFLPYLQLIAGGTGAGTPIISKNKFARLKYPVCVDFRFQKQIADILSTYDSLIELNNKRIKVLEQMAENLYKEWFVRFRFPGHETAEFENGIPKGWEIRSIAEVYDTFSGGTPSRQNADFFENGKYMWVKTGELLDRFIIDTEERITEEALRVSSAKIIPPFSLLCSMYAGVGKLGINAEEITCSQATCVFIPKTPLSIYNLFFWLKLNKTYLGNISFGAAQQNISQDVLRKLKIVVPADGVAENFEKAVCPLFQQILILQKKNANLTKQRDLLLPRLMSGKLEARND